MRFMEFIIQHSLFKKRNYKNEAMKIISLIFLILTVSVIQLSAQDDLITVSGKVTEYETGEDIIATTITEKGTDNVTMTDINGNFSIKVKKDATLIFSYIGYIGREVMVESDRIDIILEPDYSSITPKYCFPKRKTIVKPEIGTESYLPKVESDNNK